MAIVTFIGAWNNFFWPFIVTNSTPMLTIPGRDDAGPIRLWRCLCENLGHRCHGLDPNGRCLPYLPEASDPGSHGGSRNKVAEKFSDSAERNFLLYMG